MGFAVTSGPVVRDNLTDGNTIVLTGVGAGDSIIVAALWNGASVTSLDNVTISGESNATLLTALGPSNPDSTRSRLGYLANVTSGGDKTITFDLSGATGGSGEAFAVAVSGGNTSSLLDVEGSATGSSTTPTVNLTTTLSGALIVAIANSNNADPSTGSGYTGIALANQHWYVHGQYLVGAGAAGTKTVDMSTAGSGAWTINAAAFKAADGTAGGNNDLAGGATAGATGSATITVQRNLASAAVAGALASGTLKIDRALTSSAIGAALGSATLSAFTKVWRVPTNAPNGTTVKIMIVSGTSPNYTIAQQGTAVVAGGYADLPTDGTPGTLSFALMHNYNDNTATTSIYGGGYIATLTSI